jgi:hypothetical protein
LRIDDADDAGPGQRNSIAAGEHSMMGFILFLVLGAIAYGAFQRGKNPFSAVLKAIGLFFAVPILLVLGLVGLAYLFGSPATSPAARETPVAFASPVSGPPAVSPTGIPAAPPPATTAVDRLGRMLNDAAIVDARGTTIGMVHEGRPVHIIGTKIGGWIRIRKHDGQEGFVAADSVADVGEWAGSVPERMGSP